MSSSNRSFEENEDIENSEAYEDAEGYEDSAGSDDTGEEEKIKNPEKFRKHEVRKALMGNLFRDEDSGYLVVGGDFRIVLWGAADGADNAFLYGVSRRKYEYETELKNNTQAVYQVNEAMAGIGRRILFESAPNAASVLVKGGFFRPAVLIFEEVFDEKNKSSLFLSVYTGRAPLSFLSIRHAVKKLEKAMEGKIHKKKK